MSADAVAPASMDERKDWLTLFKQYDVNKDGYIPMQDLRSRIDQAGNNAGLSRDQKNKLLENADHNGDRQIDFEEFCLLVRSCEADEVSEREESCCSRCRKRRI